MYQDNEYRVKKTDEIEKMVRQLNPTNKLRVLSAVNALLYSQKIYFSNSRSVIFDAMRCQLCRNLGTGWTKLEV